MSRELKFRVWSVYSERFLEHFDYRFSDALRFDCGSLITEVGTLDDICIIEQCIGIKDKNGKEIYEGDIVSVYEFDKKSMREVYKYTTDIRWNNRSAMFWTGYAESLCDEITEDHYEIIGNIHENPELLGDEK